MQKKLNEDFIDSYCERFAAKVAPDFFKNGRQVITGRQILSAAPSRQVNFFVIKLLFRYWQEETKKLESPFFNYKHKEVRKAMVQFMNVLSRHIEIEHKQFELLLNHAVKDTIYLAALPQAYIEVDLDSRGVYQIRDKTIEGTVKYLRIYKKKISDFLSDMKGLTIDDVLDELPDEFDDFDTTQTVKELCKQLAPVLEISTEKIYSDDPDIDDFDNEIIEPGEEDLVETPTPHKRTVPESPRISASTEKEDPTSEKTEKNKNPIGQTLTKEEEHPPARYHRPQEESSSILKLIPLNQRYLFTKELFRNDKNDFELALAEIEKYHSFDEAVEFLVQNYAKYNEWNMQSDEVREFLKVLFRKFRD